MQNTCFTKRFRVNHLVQSFWSRWLPLLLVHFGALLSCDAPASVHLYSDTGWPHARTPHFSYHQILHIFDLENSTIHHQLNYYCRRMSEMRKNWLLMPTFARGSKTVLFLWWSLRIYVSFLCSLSLSVYNRKEQWKLIISLNLHFILKQLLLYWDTLHQCYIYSRLHWLLF